MSLIFGSYRACIKPTIVDVGVISSVVGGGGVFSCATYWVTAAVTVIEGLPSQTGSLAIHCTLAISSCVMSGPEQLRK